MSGIKGRPRVVRRYHRCTRRKVAAGFSLCRQHQRQDEIARKQDTEPCHQGRFPSGAPRQHVILWTPDLRGTS